MSCLMSMCGVCCSTTCGHANYQQADGSQPAEQSSLPHGRWLPCQRGPWCCRIHRWHPRATAAAPPRASGRSGLALLALHRRSVLALHALHRGAREHMTWHAEFPSSQAKRKLPAADRSRRGLRHRNSIRSHMRQSTAHGVLLVRIARAVSTSR